jgi:hypothetical protein
VTVDELFGGVGGDFGDEAILEVIAKGDEETTPRSVQILCGEPRLRLYGFELVHHLADRRIRFCRPGMLEVEIDGLGDAGAVILQPFNGVKNLMTRGGINVREEERIFLPPVPSAASSIRPRLSLAWESF